MSGVRFPSLRVANQLLPKRGLFLGFRVTGREENFFFSYHLSGIALGVSHVSLSLFSLLFLSSLSLSLSLSPKYSHQTLIVCNLSSKASA